MIASWNKYVYVRYHFLHCLFLFSEVAKPGLSHFLSMWFLFESAEALGLRCIFNEDAGTNASYVLFLCWQATLEDTSYEGNLFALVAGRPEINELFVGYTHSPRLCTPQAHVSKQCYWVFSLSTKTECGRSDQVKYSCSQFSAASSWREYVYVARWINLPSPHLA